MSDYRYLGGDRGYYIMYVLIFFLLLEVYYIMSSLVFTVYTKAEIPRVFINVYLVRARTQRIDSTTVKVYLLTC